MSLQEQVLVYWRCLFSYFVLSAASEESEWLLDDGGAQFVCQFQNGNIPSNAACVHVDMRVHISV